MTPDGKILVEDDAAESEGPGRLCSIAAPLTGFFRGKRGIVAVYEDCLVGLSRLEVRLGEPIQGRAEINCGFSPAELCRHFWQALYSEMERQRAFAIDRSTT